MKIETSIVRINPAKAEYLLRQNTANRVIKAGLVASMIRDMKAGNWQFNGDSIRVAADGELLDGQHRLTACARSGVDIETVLVTGLDNSVKTTIDSGSKRTVGDRLQMIGTHNATTVAAAINYLWAIAIGRQGIIPTASEAMDFIDNHPGIAKSAHKSLRAFPGVDSKLAALHYIGCYIGKPRAADDFVSVWRSGVPCYHGDPAHALREKFLKTRGTANTISPNIQLRLACHSLNLFLAGKSVNSIRLPEEMRVPGWSADDFIAPRR